MEFYLTSAERPAPQRKRKQVVNALEEHEEYLQLKAAVLGGRMRKKQAAIIKMGPEDAKKLDYKFPWRAATDSLKRLLKATGIEADYLVEKYETADAGIWAVRVTYDPPEVKSAVPHAEETRRPGRTRKTA